MKRLLLSIVLIAAIIAFGLSAIAYIDAHNSRLYGKLELVLEDYNSGRDATDSIKELTDYCEIYKRRLSFIIDEELLGSISASSARLMPMYTSGSDEFTAECFVIRDCAKRIIDSERPTLSRIL